MVLTAGYDILRDEGVLYVKRLQLFNVNVLWNHYSKAYHGVFNMRFSKQREEFFNDIAKYIKVQLDEV